MFAAESSTSAGGRSQPTVGGCVGGGSAGDGAGSELARPHQDGRRAGARRVRRLRDRSRKYSIIAELLV